jgi:enoyl-CoA hydratase/carnithine racemase
MSTDKHLMEEKRGSHLWPMIDRAEKANALMVGLMERITAAIFEAANDANVKAVILTGAGERVFARVSAAARRYISRASSSKPRRESISRTFRTRARRLP